MYIVCMDEVNRSMTRRDTHKNAQISSFCSMFPRISKFCVFVMFFLLCFQSWFIKVKQTHFPDACICTDRKRHSIHNHLSYVRMSKEEDEKKSQSETRAQYIFELCENGKANSTQRTSAFFFWLNYLDYANGRMKCTGCHKFSSWRFICSFSIDSSAFYFLVHSL